MIFTLFVTIIQNILGIDGLITTTRQFRKFCIILNKKYDLNEIFDFNSFHPKYLNDKKLR